MKLEESITLIQKLQIQLNYIKQHHCNIFLIYQLNKVGFVKSRGTTEALNNITDIIYKNLDISKILIITFIDFANAFDTVSHKLLLEKLEGYGIRDSLLDLIPSYLSNRTKWLEFKTEIVLKTYPTLEFRKKLYLDFCFSYCMLMIYCEICRKYWFVLR